MELTFVTDLGQSFVVEIDPNMELENVMALLEAEVSWPLPYFTKNKDLTSYILTCLYSLAFRYQSRASHTMEETWATQKRLCGS